MDLFKNLSLNSKDLEIELVKKENIKIVKEYLKEEKLNPKIILTSLLFFHNIDNISFIENDKDLTQDIKEISKNLVNTIIKGEYNKEICYQYQEIFLRWKEADKKQKEDMEEKIKATTKKLMKKAFWDKIYQDLEKKDNHYIELLLIELRDNIKGLCINENQRTSIDQQFDIIIIKQIIDHGEMEEKDFDMFFGNLAKTVRSLQSPVNDKALDDAIKVIRTQINTNWREAFVSSMKVLTEAVSQIYIDLLKLAK